MAVIGGGFKAIRSVLRYSAKIGPFKLCRTVRSKNACKACAFGTGGQQGGMHNESGKGIEICNKNIQAQLSDSLAPIAVSVIAKRPISELAQMSGKQLEELGRLGTPVYKQAGDSHYFPIGYDQAQDIIAARLQATTPTRSFFYASGRSSNEAAFSLQLLARLYGSNNVNNCSYYCHQASGVALSNVIGTGTATIRYEDLSKADVIFVFGANPASNHPRFVKTLFQCRRRGGHVIIVNPAKEPGLVRFASPSDLRSMLKGGEPVASLYIQPHLGGDIALMHGIARWLLENSYVDREFIRQHTSGFEAFAAAIAQLSWHEIVEQSGVDREQIVAVAKVYSTAKHTIFSWSMGLTHHLHGVANIETVAALALLRGMIGKPGAGLLPLRGHSNIQGTGSMGFTPQLKVAMQQKIEDKLGFALPATTGLDTMGCMNASQRGDIDAAIMLGGNLLACNPDTEYAKAALNNVPFKCFINSSLNRSHVYGVDGETIVLPIKVRDEETQATTQESMFNFIRLSDGGIERLPSLLSEMDIICTLGTKLVAKDRFDFSLFLSHSRVRAFVGDVAPGFEQLKNIDESKQEFHIEGRTLYEPVFNTADGKAQFCFHPSPGIERKPSRYTLTSVRSEGQFNSIIYHEYDSYRSQTERWVVMMNPEDMQAEGLVENQRVTLATAIGKMENVKVKPFDIRRGNLMTYYPEANVLIPNAVDERSKTPGFKSVTVMVSAKT